jgi:hypothetical protein
VGYVTPDPVLSGHAAGTLVQVTPDNNPLARIHELVEEERQLRDRLQRREISADEEHARLRAIEVELDQCWDLLRQRRALRETGGDPREAKIRPPDEVEGYLG